MGAPNASREPNEQNVPTRPASKRVRIMGPRVKKTGYRRRRITTRWANTVY